jgi:hypothetical protein
MKVITLHAIGKEGKDVEIHFVAGSGLFWHYGEENKATIIETIKGTLLVKETPEQIRALIANKEGEN